MNLFFLPGFLLLFVFSSPLLAEEPLSADNQQRLKQLDSRIAAIETAQKNLLAQQDEILSRIGQIKTWKRHSGHRTTH
ncbi:MAG: hypothetical protein HYZ84_03100 [Candidatus Omnitrophica bacterium]|nr:hypothetical protein [Candidatus Omnitrophota bacterium]